MATGFNRALEEGHDAVYDYSCTPCTQDKLNAEALFYCRNCSKLFCDACIQHHDKILQDHNVQGRAEVSKWGKVKSVKSAMMCEEHPDKDEEMYCGDHDLTCCHYCINVYHRTCKQVNQVSTVAKGIQKTLEFQSFLTNAANTQTRLRNLLVKREKNTKLLQKACNEISSSFKDIRKNFNIFLDNAEKELSTEMDKLLSGLQSHIQSDIDTCSDMEKQIQKFLDNIKNLGNHCEEFAFQSFQKCARKLSSAEELLSSMVDEEYQLKFTPDPSIQKYQASIKSFGKFDITPYNLPLAYVYTVDNLQKHNIRTKTDTQYCDIRGISQLPDGQLAIVDTKNQKVKLLSSSQYSVISELDLPPYPQDICTTTGTQLVVTVCSLSGSKLTRSELHFINAAGGHLTHKGSKQLDHGCSGIACHNGQLFVGSNTAVYEYSLSGQKNWKIYENTSGPKITVYRFAVSDDGNIIYTKPDQDCLLTRNKAKQQLSIPTNPQLQMPTGVCVADTGAVFVCGWMSNTVIQMDSQGKKKIVTLAKASDRVHRPQSLCFDRKLKQLLIGQANSDNLVMLKLK